MWSQILLPDNYFHGLLYCFQILVLPNLTSLAVIMILFTLLLVHEGWNSYIICPPPPIIYCRLRARRGLLQFKDVPLRIRRALSLYKVYGDSAFLVLNGTPLNCNKALLAFNWQYATVKLPIWIQTCTCLGSSSTALQIGQISSSSTSPSKRATSYPIFKRPLLLQPVKTCRNQIKPVNHINFNENEYSCYPASIS